MPRRRRLSTTTATYSSAIDKRQSPGIGRQLGVIEAADTQDCQVSSTTSNLMQEVQNLPLVNAFQLHQHDTELEADKQTILNHPLYPLLAILLEQCELASAQPNSPPPLDAFDEELISFINRRHETRDFGTSKPDRCKKDTNYCFETPTRQTRRCRQESTNKLNGGCLTSGLGSTKGRGACNGEFTPDSTPRLKSMVPKDDLDGVRHLNVFVQDNEVNELIVKAIQVLRIHLLELHKVNELCKDFCSRYIHSLKTKFQTDPLIQDSQPSSPGDSEVPSPAPHGYYGSRYFTGSTSTAMSPFGYPITSELIPHEYRQRLRGAPEEDPYHLNSELSPSRSAYSIPTEVSNGFTSEVDNMCYTPNCHLLESGNRQYNLKDSSLNEDTFGSIHPFLAPYAMNPASFHARLDNLCIGGKQKRGVLPKRATQIMKQWLFQHLVHPYPTEDEKRQIAGQTNLTLLQVNNWFINARRRILQPMLDSSNFVPLGGNFADDMRDGIERNDSVTHVISKKKKSTNSRPSNNRFWPASLVAAAAIHPVAAGLVSSGGGTSTTCPVFSSESGRCSAVEHPGLVHSPLDACEPAADEISDPYKHLVKSGKEIKQSKLGYNLEALDGERYAPNDRMVVRHMEEDDWRSATQTYEDGTKMHSPIVCSTTPEYNEKKNTQYETHRIPLIPTADAEENCPAKKHARIDHGEKSAHPMEGNAFPVDRAKDHKDSTAHDNEFRSGKQQLRSEPTSDFNCPEQGHDQIYTAIRSNNAYQMDTSHQLKIPNFSTTDYSSVLLNRAQQYTNYLASGIQNALNSSTESYHGFHEGNHLLTPFNCIPNLPSVTSPNIPSQTNFPTSKFSHPEGHLETNWVPGGLYIHDNSLRPFNTYLPGSYCKPITQQLKPIVENEPNPRHFPPNAFTKEPHFSTVYESVPFQTQDLILPRTSYSSFCDYSKLPNLFNQSRTHFNVSQSYQPSTQTPAP